MQDEQEPLITETDFYRAKELLGLTMEQLAEMLGYSGNHLTQQAYRVMKGNRRLRPPQARLLQAYLDGYRPADWPVK
jgi:transcriptional regulator with XRE-family HTH domain